MTYPIAFHLHPNLSHYIKRQFSDVMVRYVVMEKEVGPIGDRLGSLATLPSVPPGEQAVELLRTVANAG
jgi:hypothetical protein